jgi:hypothetical protein
MAELHSYYPSSPSDKRKKASKSGKYIIHRKRDERKERPPAIAPPPVAVRLLLLHSFWVGTSRHQWPPGSSSLLGRISLWSADQRLSRVGNCPLSIPLPSRPSCRAFSAGVSIGCSGGRDAPVAGLPSCLRLRTTSSCRRLGVRTLLGTSPLAHVRTLVGRTWLPEASHCSLGWVSCFQLCLSVDSRGAYCICQPPSRPPPPSWLLRLIWSCSPPRCIFVLVLCLLCGPVSLDTLGNLLPHFWGCQSFLGPSGFWSLWLLPGDSLCIG